MTRFKNIVLWTVLISMLIHLPVLEPAQALGLTTSDYVDLTGGKTVSWQDTAVLYASKWITITPTEWRDENAGVVKTFTTQGIPYVDPRKDFANPDAGYTQYDGPKVRFVVSNAAKVSDKFIEAIPTDDGRLITVKEYTIAVDVAAFTEETYLTYFNVDGNTPLQKTYTEELCRLEVQDLNKTGTGYKAFIRDRDNPEYPDEFPYHEVSSAYIKFKGYDLNENYFNHLATIETTGTLTLQVSLNIGDWKNAFKNILTDNGNFSYTHNIWSRIVGIKCQDTQGGLIRSRRVNEPLVDSHASPNKDVQKGPEIQDEPDDSAGQQQRTLDKGELSDSNSGVDSKLVSVHGQYLKDESGPVYPDRKSGWVAQGSVVGENPRMWLTGGQPITYSGSAGYDPQVSSQSAVSFGARFRLKPEVGYSLYKHVWSYDAKSYRAYLYDADPRPRGIFFLHCSPAKDWLEVIGNGASYGMKSKTIVNSWYLKNVFARSTFFITVQIAAFYNWEPAESMEDYNGGLLSYLGLEEGDSSFPIVNDGFEEVGIEAQLMKGPFRWIFNPAAALMPFTLAGLVVLAVWLYWAYQAYSKSHPKAIKAQRSDAGGPWMMMRTQGQPQAYRRSFFSYFTEQLGKKILTTIVVFIIMLIIFCIIM